MMADVKDWQAIGRALAAPFAPECVEWRPQGKTGPGKRVRLLPYIDARAVQDRLDEVVGMEGWSFDWQPLVIEGGEVRRAKGTLTIHGVSKSDVGTESAWEPTKGCISDALKRSAVLFRIGRYLYALPDVWVTLDNDGNVPVEMLAKLRARLEARKAS